MLRRSARSNIFSRHHFLFCCTVAVVSLYQPFIFQLSPSQLMFLPYHSSMGLLQLHTSVFIFRFIIPFSSLLQAHAAHVEFWLQFYLHSVSPCVLFSVIDVRFLMQISLIMASNLYIYYFQDQPLPECQQTGVHCWLKKIGKTQQLVSSTNVQGQSNITSMCSIVYK